MFFINVPVGVVAGLLALRLVPRAAGGPPARRRRGARAHRGARRAHLRARRGRGRHWGSVRTVGLLAAAAALLAAFALVERRVARPLIAPPTWRVRSLVSSAAMMLGATAIWSARSS